MTTFLFGEKDEIPFLEGVNEELVELVGMEAEYYLMHKEGSKENMLYQEEDEHFDFEPPFTMKMIVQNFDDQFIYEEEGTVHEKSLIGWVTRKRWNDTQNVRDKPLEGDAVEIFNHFWDVNDVLEPQEAFPGQLPQILFWELDLNRRSDQIPEDRIIGEP